MFGVNVPDVELKSTVPEGECPDICTPMGIELPAEIMDVTGGSVNVFVVADCVITVTVARLLIRVMSVDGSVLFT